MLKPIKYIACSGALGACQILMQRFALWLCNPRVKSAQLNLASLIKNMPSEIEAYWLNDFLGKTHETLLLRTAANTLADLNSTEKKALKDWIIACSSISRHFQPAPPAAPLPTVQPFKAHQGGDIKWVAFRTLMDAFYERGFREGLPYRADGTPTALINERVTYEAFRTDFLRAHKLNPDPFARDVCVICGAEMRKPSVDHWVPKRAYPLLSVCADNLLPICGTCNENPNKGSKPVHLNGSFSDWFHPYNRHPRGGLHLEYRGSDFRLGLTSTDPEQSNRVENLNRLFKLEDRWTREFKAEYCKVKKTMLQKKQTHFEDEKLSLQQLHSWIQEWSVGLIESEPHFEVHKALSRALLDPVRMSVWLDEFNERARNPLLKKPITSAT